MANKTLKKNTKEDRFAQVKNGVAKINKEILKISDDAVDSLLNAGGEWQKVMARSIEKGKKFMGSQQDFVFETLEAIKGQHSSNVKRFQNLISLKDEKGNVANKASEKAKQAPKAAPVKAEVKKAAKTVASAKKEVKAVVKNTLTDLKVVNGIGPKVESILKEANIKTLSDLASTPVKKLKTVLEGAGARYKSFDPTPWIEEAKTKLNK